MQCEIRRARSEDIHSLARIYRESIRHLGKHHYSVDQVAAWSSFSGDTDVFQDWINEATTFVAVTGDDGCIGFGGLQAHGRISSLFVAPEFMRRGVAASLLERLLDEARLRGLDTVTTEASEFSRPLFQKYGFTLIEVEHTEFKGVGFSRYVMRLRI
jgi:putative acetyltransferase